MSGLVHLLTGKAAGSHDDGPVGIAENDLRAHGDQFVHEEKPALVHLFVDDNRALGLGSRHQCDAHEVGREGRPRCIVDLGHRAAEVCTNTEILLLLDYQRVARVRRCQACPLPGAFVRPADRQRPSPSCAGVRARRRRCASSPGVIAPNPM